MAVFIYLLAILGEPLLLPFRELEWGWGAEGIEGGGQAILYVWDLERREGSKMNVA